MVAVDLDAVEIKGDACGLCANAVFEAGRAELYVVGVPMAEAFVGEVGRRSFVDDGAHAVVRSVSVADLDFVTVLEIHAAVAAGFADKELHVQAEIAISFFGHDISGAKFPAVGGAVIGHEDAGAGDDGIGYDLPFDGKGGGEAWAGPVRPFGVERGAGTVDKHFSARERHGADANLGTAEG